MKVQFGQDMPRNENVQGGERESKGQTYIAANIVKESVCLDRNSNEIDFRTKRIIKRVGDE